MKDANRSAVLHQFPASSRTLSIVRSPYTEPITPNASAPTKAPTGPAKAPTAAPSSAPTIPSPKSAAFMAATSTSGLWSTNKSRRQFSLRRSTSETSRRRSEPPRFGGHVTDGIPGCQFFAYIIGKCRRNRRCSIRWACGSCDTEISEGQGPQLSDTPSTITPIARPRSKSRFRGLRRGLACRLARSGRRT